MAELLRGLFLDLTIAAIVWGLFAVAEFGVNIFSNNPTIYITYIQQARNVLVIAILIGISFRTLFSVITRD